MQPKQHDVIFISNPTDKYAINGSFYIKDLSRNYLEILCNDIEFSDPDFPKDTVIVPEMCHILDAFNFSKGKSDLLITCQAGISRSSAIAYLLKVNEVGAKEAFDVLDLKRHYPNPLLIKHGSIFLKKPEIVSLMEIWKNKAMEIQAEEGFKL